MDAVTHVLVWLNAVANAFGRVLLAPIAILPGWLSATLIAAGTGLVLLGMFKYTSNQSAIKRVRDEVKADLLALKLFKDSPAVTFLAQGRVFRGAFKLMLLSIIPMLVMALPVCLMLGQIALWYQARPLHVGEETLVSLKFGGAPSTMMPEVQLKPSAAFETGIGPVRVPSERTMYWSIKAKQPGRHLLAFRLGELAAQKEFVVGNSFMRTSKERPGWNWKDVLLHPWETPFPPHSLVHSIDIQYPGRVSWTSGTDTWIAYWFVVSMLAAFVGRSWLKVNI